jgi:hypothetical protein
MIDLSQQLYGFINIAQSRVSVEQLASLLRIISSVGFLSWFVSLLIALIFPIRRCFFLHVCLRISQHNIDCLRWCFPDFLFTLFNNRLHCLHRIDFNSTALVLDIGQMFHSLEWFAGHVSSIGAPRWFGGIGSYFFNRPAHALVFIAVVFIGLHIAKTGRLVVSGDASRTVTCLAHAAEDTTYHGATHRVVIARALTVFTTLWGLDWV